MEIEDAQILGLQVVDVFLFKAAAAFGDQMKVRIVKRWSFQTTSSHFTVQYRQMFATAELGEIRGGEMKGIRCASGFHLVGRFLYAEI
ncbi:MAG: hypothetical protein IPL46_19965 [Saprospiraceae bacterium]|nr:hypothetical protein [Saprospiraceae bacterium]